MRIKSTSPTLFWAALWFTTVSVASDLTIIPPPRLLVIKRFVSEHVLAALPLPALAPKEANTECDCGFCH